MKSCMLKACFDCTEVFLGPRTYWTLAWLSFGVEVGGGGGGGGGESQGISQL